MNFDGFPSYELTIQTSKYCAFCPWDLRLLLPPALIPHAQQGSREAESAVTEKVHHHRAAARKLQELRVDPWMGTK